MSEFRIAPKPMVKVGPADGPPPVHASGAPATATPVATPAPTPSAHAFGSAAASPSALGAAPMTMDSRVDSAPLPSADHARVIYGCAPPPGFGGAAAAAAAPVVDPMAAKRDAFIAANQATFDRHHVPPDERVSVFMQIYGEPTAVAPVRELKASNLADIVGTLKTARASCAIKAAKPGPGAASEAANLKKIDGILEQIDFFVKHKASLDAFQAGTVAPTVELAKANTSRFLSAHDNMFLHFLKHRDEMTDLGVHSMMDYQLAAHNFQKAPPSASVAYHYDLTARQSGYESSVGKFDTHSGLFSTKSEAGETTTFFVHKIALRHGQLDPRRFVPLKVV